MEVISKLRKLLLIISLKKLNFTPNLTEQAYGNDIILCRSLDPKMKVIFARSKSSLKSAHST